MGFDPAIRAKVRKLALDKKKKLTAEDIFLSDEFKRYLNSLATTMGNGKGETTRIIIRSDGPNGGTAFTTGSMMYINCTSCLLDFYDSLESKFVALMGFFFHEKAHDLFYDFNEFRNAMRYLRSGSFYGDKPENMTAKEEADWVDMEDALEAPHTRKIFESVYNYLENCVADAHDEECLIDAYGSFVGESIYLLRQSLRNGAETFETGVRKVNTGEEEELTFMSNNILQLSRFDNVIARRQSAVETSDYWQTLEKIRDHARIACATDDINRRFSELNWMMLYFWPYIRNAIQKLSNQNQGDASQQTQSSGNQSNDGSQSQGSQQSSGDQSQGNQQQSSGGQNNQQGQSGAQQRSSSASEAVVQQILDALNKGAQNSGQTKAPENHHSSDIAITRRANERNGKVPEKNQAGAKEATEAMSKQGKEALYQILDSIANDIARNQAEDELEAEAEEALTDTVAAVNASGPHAGIPVYTHRVLSVSEADVLRYDSIMQTLRPVSKRLQKQMLDALRDLKDGFIQKHKQFGRTIVPSDAYRPDQRFFADKKLPQDLPDMALSVLVDHSGSMRGERISSAMKAALLLHDFCTGMNIPIAVAGHNAEYGSCVNYYVYADYEQISKKDKFRAAQMAATITRMQADNCNRDGAALLIAAKMLERRTEQVRLLMIISDGRPADRNYGGDEAAKDLQNIVKQCKQKGIEVLACAIGDDKENIKAIYGDSFVDISDLSKLPKTLVGIVKKRIINSAF